MRYRQSIQYRKADPKKMKLFIGLKAKKEKGDNFRFKIDEHDARLIVANLRLKEYDKFIKEFKKKSYSSFRLLQDFEYRRNRK